MNIKCKPICKCGHIFEEIKIAYLELELGNGYVYQVPKFIPSYCPKCGKAISSVTSDSIKELGVISEDELKQQMDKELKTNRK